MNTLTDKEIFNASTTIDKALLSMDKTNRGEVASRILSVVRNLNDHIADKVWSELRPNQPMSINKVASKFGSVSPYQFVARFDKFLRVSVSHFTPSEEGAERLLIKYYRYILQLKKLVHDRYGMDIIRNIDCFLEDLDEQTKDYYAKVAAQIEITARQQRSKNLDNYYVDMIKPFYVNHEIYFEVALEPAMEKPNKFNRITAFTKCDITTNYCVALDFSDATINVFGVDFPVKIITEWHVSIRPCEINNFAQILNITSSIQRGNLEYKALMDYLEKLQVSLVDILDYDDSKYDEAKQQIVSATKNKRSVIFEILDKCRYISACNRAGTNILRYLLYRMKNQIIKDQWPFDHDKTYGGLYLSSKCLPFDSHPFSFNPKGHISNLYELFECIDTTGHESELLARYIEKNTSQNSVLFTPIDNLKLFGAPDEIEKLLGQYNAGIYSGFRPDAELGIYKNHIYNKGYEARIVEILSKLKELSDGGSTLSAYFSEENIKMLKSLPGEFRLDDPEKEAILNSMFTDSRVHLIYGAAGTGKTTLVNHISRLMLSRRKIFLAKTNPAVENLRRRVISCNDSNEFTTIDRFTKNSHYQSMHYDLIVVDECSTVKNEEILKILNIMDDGVLVLVGDTYQIEAIGYGNWFSICKNEMPEFCCHELTVPYRSSDEFLKKLWKEVRNMTDDNTVLEEMVRSDYSHPIDNDIFDKKIDDEIILCLNYNGLYGLNNINKLLQLNNPNKAVDIGVWRFKIGDPILFNDSGRFDILYNNLKGKLIGIQDKGNSIYFTVEVELKLTEGEVACCDGLDFINSNTKKTTVGFVVNRMPPYSSDEENTSNENIVPFQIAYAVSIHKSQGLEYDSVKIVIADETENRITHNIFYTAVTRAKSRLTIYWSPEVCNRILSRIRPANYKKDYYLLKEKNSSQIVLQG